VGDKHESVKIRSYPKAIFLYPSFIMAVIAGILATFMQKTTTPEGVMLYPGLPGKLFIVVFALNLMIFAWDFSRAGFVTVLLLGVIGILGGILLEQKIDLFTGLSRFFHAIELRAHPHFYFAFASIFGFVLVLSFVQSRIDYWEVHGNELLHVTGFVGNVERFPAPNLRFRKELPDLFEYALARSGTLILEPVVGERHALTNVLFVNGIEARIQEMLSTIDVTVETSPRPNPAPAPQQSAGPQA
jgi:hypothetical protein